MVSIIGGHWDGLKHRVFNLLEKSKSILSTMKKDLIDFSG